jgi:hypothetical protein
MGVSPSQHRRRVGLRFPPASCAGNQEEGEYERTDGASQA